MIEINHQYSLAGDWQREAAKSLGKEIIQNKIAIFPEHIADGVSYFLPVMEGISVVLLNAVFKTDVIINRNRSEEDLYILQFDVSEKINLLTVNESKSNIDHSGLEAGFSVMHCHIESSFKPVIGQRIMALRLVIDKQVLFDHIIKKNKKIKNIEKKILFYNHTNSQSKVLLNTIKNKNVFDLDFESYIRGVSLLLFANFIDTYTNPTKEELHKIDVENICSTKNYLLSNLYNKFPSVTFLAKMANMSDTKYKVLFKKIHNTTPNRFFTKHKMILANKLLKSGDFVSLTQILDQLSYNKYAQLYDSYTKMFGRKPFDDFIKKEQ